MKTNGVPVTLPIVASGLNASAPIDVGTGFDGFTVQFENVTAATAVQYGVQGSLDGEVWVEMTNTLRDLGNGAAAITGPITTDSIYDYPTRFPGVIRLLCKHAPSSPPGSLPTAFVAFQDSSKV